MIMNAERVNLGIILGKFFFGGGGGGKGRRLWLSTCAIGKPASRCCISSRNICRNRAAAGSISFVFWGRPAVITNYQLFCSFPIIVLLARAVLYLCFESVMFFNSKIEMVL